MGTKSLFALLGILVIAVSSNFLYVVSEKTNWFSTSSKPGTLENRQEDEDISPVVNKDGILNLDVLRTTRLEALLKITDEKRQLAERERAMRDQKIDTIIANIPEMLLRPLKMEKMS